MMEFDKILSTEYSSDFDKKRKNRMIMSYYKYGPIKINYGDSRLVNSIDSLKVRLAKYEETGNTEFLADIANFAMIEYMHPQHPNAHFKATDSDESPGLVGMSINEIKSFTD